MGNFQPYICENLGITNENQQPLKIFIAFANEDRDVSDKLLAQMNLLKTREHWDIWASHEIKTGSVWSEEIKARLNDSEIVVLLMSSSFFNSNYILDIELPAIIEKHRVGNCHIIPVLAKICLWKDTPFGEHVDLGKIQALPSGERPIVSRGAWDSDDDPYVETVLGIKTALRDFRIKRAEQDRFQLIEVQKNQKEQQEKLRKQKEIDEKRSIREAEKMQLESTERFSMVEWPDKVEISTRQLPSRKYYYIGGVGFVILMTLLVWSRFQGASEKATKTNEFVSQSNPLIKQESIDSQFLKTKPTTTKKGISSLKGHGTGRWAVRASTFTYMEGARRRLEEVIKAGYPNAEISKTKYGLAAVIVLRTNDKEAAIRVVDDLETKGIDAAVFDRTN